MSEYGSGYATCLRQFTNHRTRLEEDLATYSHMRELHGDDRRLFTETHAIELWAHGASDHLYDLERPTAISDEEWRCAEDIRGRMIHVGHSYAPSSKSSAVEARGLLEEAEKLLRRLEMPTATLEEAMTADRALGLTPDSGEHTCPFDLQSRGEGRVVLLGVDLSNGEDSTVAVVREP